METAVRQELHSDPLLTVSGIEVSIGRSKILNGVSFDIHQGSTVGIIGTNGSGKTTLFNCISGFVPASHGTIHLEGLDITHAEPHERAKAGLGRVFQNFGVFREMTVLENMTAALECHESWFDTVLPWGRTARRLREASIELLKEVNLQDKIDSKAGSLSGGQMRLLEIIRTVAFKAKFFLLDEPTAGVSPKMKDSIAELILKLQGMGKTVLIIEHDINFIQRFCGRILVLDGGKVVLDDTPERVRQNKVLQEIYFGVAK